MKAAEAYHLGFLRGHCKVELAQPVRQFAVKPLGFLSISKRTDEVISVPQNKRFPLAVRLDSLFKPQIQPKMEVDIRQYRRYDTSLRRAGLRMQYFAVRVQHACLQPFANQVQESRIVDPLLKHPDQPVMVDVVEKALDVGLNDIPVFPELKIELQIFDGLPGASGGSVTVAGVQKISLKNRRQQPGTGRLKQSVL